MAQKSGGKHKPKTVKMIRRSAPAPRLTFDGNATTTLAEIQAAASTLHRDELLYQESKRETRKAKATVNVGLASLRELIEDHRDGQQRMGVVEESAPPVEISGPAHAT